MQQRVRRCRRNDELVGTKGRMLQGKTSGPSRSFLGWFTYKMMLFISEVREEACDLSEPDHAGMAEACLKIVNLDDVAGSKLRILLRI